MRRPRQFLANGPDLKQAYNLYSICVFTGTEGDVFHRIVGQHDKYHWVGFASEPIQMGQELKKVFHGQMTVEELLERASGV